MFRTVQPSELKAIGKHDLFIFQISDKNPIFSGSAISDQIEFLAKNKFEQSVAVSTGYLHRWTLEGDAALQGKITTSNKVAKDAERKERTTVNKLLSAVIYKNLRPVRWKPTVDKNQTPGLTPKFSAPGSSKNSKEMKEVAGELEKILGRKLSTENGFYNIKLTEEEQKNEEATDKVEELKRSLYTAMRKQFPGVDAKTIEQQGFLKYLTTLSGTKGSSVDIIPWSAIAGKKPLSDYCKAATDFKERLSQEKKVELAFNTLIEKVAAERIKNANLSKTIPSEELTSRIEAFKLSVRNYLEEEICYFQMLINIGLEQHQNEATKGGITYLGYPYKSSVIGTLVFSFMCDINPEIFTNSATKNIFRFFDNTDILQENASLGNNESKSISVRTKADETIDHSTNLLPAPALSKLEKNASFEQKKPVVSPKTLAARRMSITHLSTPNFFAGRQVKSDESPHFSSTSSGKPLTRTRSYSE